MRDQYADDYTPISTVTVDVLNRLKNGAGREYDIVVQLMANCPLRTALHIRAAVENFEVSNTEFQISCFQFGWMNPWWPYWLQEDGTPSALFDENIRGKRSQDLDQLFCPTGAIWIANTEALLGAGSFYGPNFKMFPMDWQSAIDIDEMDDLKMAEALFHVKNERT